MHKIYESKGQFDLENQIPIIVYLIIEGLNKVRMFLIPFMGVNPPPRKVNVIYSSSGDMNGNIDRITLDIKNNLLIHEYKSIHSNPLKKEEYKVSENNVLDIEKYIEKYNFPMWKDLERREEFALDAPTTGMLFIFDNRKISNNPYEEYYIDYEYQIPQDGREALYELEEKLKSLKGQNNKEKNR